MPSRTSTARRGRDERDRLVLQWLYLPRYVVKRLWRLPRVRRLTLDDAEQAGMLGLLRAAELWDETRGVAFNTYAYRSIQNGILRAARRAVLVPVAEWAWRAGVRPMGWERPSRDRKSEASLSGYIDEPAVTDGEYFDADDFRAALQTLPAKLQNVIVLRFCRDLTYREIGEELKVSRGRAYQLVREAIDRLRVYHGLSPYLPARERPC